MAATGEEFLEYLQQNAAGQYLYLIYNLLYSSEGPVLIFSQKEKGYHPPAVYISRVRIVIDCFRFRLNQSNLPFSICNMNNY